MKSLPQPNGSFKPLHDILTGALHARLLRAGLALGVFDVLDDHRTADEAADRLGTHRQNSAYLLDALTTVGLVEKENGQYRNAPLAQTYLNSQAELYVGPLLTMVQSMSIDPLDDLEERVRSGPPPQEATDNFADESLWADGARSGAPWVLGEMGSRVATIVSRLPGFGSFEKMMDLGGGHGLFAMYMVAAHPAMRAVVYDRAPVVAVAEEFAATYGLTGRVLTMAGDYMSDGLGGPYDLVWAAATLNFAKDRLDELVAKIHAAIKLGGYFISLQDGWIHEKTQPATTLDWLGGLLTGGSDFRLAHGEVAEAMLRCGFRSVRSRTIESPMGVLELDVARK